MSMGSYQLEIFLSLFVVLGAAFVALVCDLLKGNNEQLRELNVELKVRREEEQKRYEMLLSSSKDQATQQPAVASAEAQQQPATEVRPARARRADQKRMVAQEALAAMERGAQMASMPRRPQVVAEAAAEPLDLPSIEHIFEHVVEQASEAPAVAAMAVAPPVSNAPPAMSTRDWSSLLNRKPATVEPAAAAPRNDLLEAVVEATGSADTQPGQTATTDLPAGFQDGFVLSRLLERRQPVSGLVVSIGVTAQQKEDAPIENVPAAVRSMVESLIGPEDFAAQSGDEEYLLIYPHLRGASAQRRLSEIAQQLWDFQLRSMGRLSVLFSWGGVEVRSESIEEAIASATERMNETRRRKVLPIDSDLRESLPKAV
jgi:hypothetical protein